MQALGSNLLLPDLLRELSVDSLFAQLKGGFNVCDRLPQKRSLRASGGVCAVKDESELPDSKVHGLLVHPNALVLLLAAIECASSADCKHKTSAGELACRGQTFESCATGG